MKNGIIKNFIRTFGHIGIIIVLAIMFFGCRGKTPPILFYTLAPMPESSAAPDLKTETGIRIGIGPVSLPDFLNKPQIVTRSSSSKIGYSEFHRWGGYLDKEFLRVISENLSVHLATEQVKTYPWSGIFHPEYQVVFDVKQFEGELQGEVILNVVWQIGHGFQEDSSVVLRRSVIREPVNPSGDDDYEALVAAQSRVLARLSAEITEVILKF